MDSTHPLKALLNFHLASDASTVVHLPFITGIVTAKHFLPSPHLAKWTSRINSLLHSKDAGARWAGLCLAHRTSICSKLVMIESAQGWLGVAIPLLFKKEPLPNLIASINLCRMVFRNATDTPEFQRQVSTPNVSKFTTALIVFLEKDSDLELKKVVLKTLARLIPLYPNIHRAFHASLLSIVSRIFSQSAPNHISQQLVEPACLLYSVLHYTGGKVGAANLWRKSLDDSISSAWTAFIGVRTTFPDENGKIRAPALKYEEPATSVTLNMERLCMSIQVIGNLLQSPTQRPVQVPVGSLMNLASKMLLVTVEDEASSNIDPIIWAMETAVIPRIWRAACDLIKCLCECIDRHLTTYLSRLLSYIAFRLEQKISLFNQVPFLETVHTLLTRCHPSHSPPLSSRLTRIALSNLMVILPSQTDVQNSMAQTDGTIKGKKGRKRARNYEGDELFKASGDVICPTIDDVKSLLISCDVLRLLLQNANVTPALHLMASRVILAISLELPQMTPATLSPYPHACHALVQKIRDTAVQLGSSTTSAMSQSLNLVLSATSGTDDQDSLRKVDMLIHPRFPPLLRPLPEVDSFALFRSEESSEEAEERQHLGLDVPLAQPKSVSAAIQDIHMDDGLKSAGLSTAPLSTGLSITSQTSTAFPVERRLDGGAASLSMTTAAEFQRNLTTSLHSVIPRESATSFTHPSQASGSTDEMNATTLEALDLDEDMPSINLESDSDSE
ncbi:rRNA processing/ribosome biogenesis-domain-containing protein [Lentinula aff. lateritia]|uniref:rRNA processing/ribosome biogenesis-domain-containing protein n=1 Tax=Lentinula aff. lateritia TaxID=2804960 RepID=A0ACC1UA37_9AGAR|nr:rRNA processing/ribosome biogenesis-domain-containing protein [Lentinula aff. lateritia]